MSASDFPLAGESFRIPKRLIESAWIEHGPFALWVVSQLKPGVIVELGSYSGYSFCAFCEAMVRSGTTGKAVAVDTWRGDEHSGFYDDRVYEELLAYTRAEFPDLARLHRGTFDDALPTFEDGSIDLLHVDGRHRYEDVSHDFLSYRPKLSDRAVVLFHDTQVREGDFGVHAFWKELAEQHPSFEFHHGNGLGVLAFGDKAEALLPGLFQAGRDPRLGGEVRTIYSRLGASLRDRVALEKMTAAVGKELKALQADASYILREIEKVRSSASWKITKVFRSGGDEALDQAVGRWRDKLENLFASEMPDEIKLGEGAPLVRNLISTHREMMASLSLSLTGPLRAWEGVVKKK
jgi:hypothetical protein